MNIIADLLLDVKGYLPYYIACEDIIDMCEAMKEDARKISPIMGINRAAIYVDKP